MLALALVAPAVLPTPFVAAALAYLGSVAFFARPAPTRWRSLAATGVLLAVGSALYALSMDGTPAISVAGLRFSGPGALVGLAVMARLALFMTVAQLGARAVSWDDLVGWASRTPQTFYAVTALVRLVPTIREDARRIVEAQRARGHGPDRGLARMRTMVPLLVPLFVGTLRRAHEQAAVLALARRGT